MNLRAGHFLAMSHGKGSCDGPRATLKRLMTRDSLRRAYKYQILYVTAQQLYEWAKEAIRGMTFKNVTVCVENKFFQRELKEKVPTVIK